MQRHVKLIREGKQPLRSRKLLRRQLQEDAVAEDDGDADRSIFGCGGWTMYRIAMARRQLMRWFSDVVSHPWLGGNLKAIASKAGSSVSSYFELNDFLFKLNLLFAVCWSLCVVLPMALEAVSAADFDDDDGGGGSAATGTNDTFYTDFGASTLGSLVAGTGSIRDSILFYGHYTPASFSGWYDLPLAYFLVIVATFVLTLSVLVYRMASLYRKNALFRTAKQQTLFGTQVLAAWDHSAGSRASVAREKSRCVLMCRELLDESQRMSKKHKAPKIYGIISPPTSQLGRVVVTLLAALVFLGGLGTGTYFLRELQIDEADGDATDEDYWRLLLAPAICTAVVWLIPVLQHPFRAFTLFKSSLIRLWWDVSVTFVAVAGFAGTYLATFALKHTGETEACWETRTGQELYRLVVLDALFRLCIDVLWIMVVPLYVVISGWLAERRGRRRQEHVVTVADEPGGGSSTIATTTTTATTAAAAPGPAAGGRKGTDADQGEFAGYSGTLPRLNVSAMFIGTAYSQGLLWAGFSFVPLLPAISLVLGFIRFYFKKGIVLYVSSPPTTVIRLSQESYVRATLFTYLLGTAFGAIILFTREPGVCGPFRELEGRLFTFLQNRVDENDAASEGWDYIFLRGIAVLVIFALSLAMLYLWYRFRAKRLLVEELQYSFDRENAEFRALLRKKNVVTAPPHLHHARGGVAEAGSQHHHHQHHNPRRRSHHHGSHHHSHHRHSRHGHRRRSRDSRHGEGGGIGAAVSPLRSAHGVGAGSGSERGSAGRAWSAHGRTDSPHSQL